MAGPSVMVRVLGDVSGLGQAFTGGATKAEGAATKIHAAFSTVLGQLNQTGVLGPFGQMLEQANSSLEQLSGHGKEASTVLLGMGGTALTAGLALQQAGSKDQAAHQQLQAAVTATGKSYSTYAGQVEEAIKHQAKFGNDAVETQNALQKLTQATHDPAEALKLLSTATDLAAAKHESLTEAATQLGKVYNGNAKLLKEYGIVVDKHTHLTAQGQTATEALAKVLAGQASASANTFSGHVKAIRTEMENGVATMGQRYGPDLTKVGAALSGVGAIMKVVQGATQLFKTTQEASTAATEAATVAEDGLNASLLANPLVLIVAAIVAVIAIIVILVMRVKVVRDAFKDLWAFSVSAFKDIWNAIKTAFDFVVDHAKDVVAALLLLLGPPGWIIAAFVLFHKQIIDFFTKLPGEIVSAIGDVGKLLTQIGEDILNGLWAGIQWVWNNVVLGWYLGLGKLIVNTIGDLTKVLEQAGKDLLGGLWAGIQWVWNNEIAGWIAIGNWISGAVGDLGSALVSAGKALIGGLWNGMKTAWNDVTGWIGGLAGQISNLAGGMFNGITNAFIGALNLLIDAWDGLHFKLPDINFGPIHISGPDIGVPNIPHIPKVDTGGYVAATGLAIIHRGETVIPPGKNSGPAVHIEHAHFGSDLDVDGFMKRVAWHTRQAAAI